ncbi:MAG: sulfite exporter TauE/SafE family protein [Elainellaceae cyanobacterium]
MESDFLQKAAQRAAFNKKSVPHAPEKCCTFLGERSPTIALFTYSEALPAPQAQSAGQYRWLWLLVEGLAVGILTGLVGGGGGFAIVPALVLLAKVPMKQAVGTSLLIIVANSVTRFLGYLGHVEIDWHLVISFIFAASLGTIPGAHWAHFVPAQKLQKIFGYFLLAIAAFVLVQNFQLP